MLKEYLEAVAERPANGLRGLDAQTHLIHALRQGMDFLRDPYRFPDSVTNMSVHSFALLLEDEVLRPAVSPPEALASLGLMTEEGHGVLLLPQDYHERVRHDPIYALGAIAHTAAAARTYQWFRNRSGRPPGPELTTGILEHFNAFEAQTLHVLAKMAAKETLTLALSPKNRSLMEFYPHGAADTPRNALYLGNPLPDAPSLTPFQIGWIGEMDFLVHADPAWLGVAIAELTVTEETPSFDALEQALQAINSPLHLHVYGAEITALPLGTQQARQDPCYNSFSRAHKNLAHLRRLSS